jgi:hypothetical protein
MSDPEVRAAGALMNLEDGHPGYDERLGYPRAGVAARCGARRCLPRSWLAASSGKAPRLNGGESERSGASGDTASMKAELAEKCCRGQKGGDSEQPAV